MGSNRNRAPHAADGWDIFGLMFGLVSVIVLGLWKILWP